MGRIYDIKRKKPKIQRNLLAVCVVWVVVLGYLSNWDTFHLQEVAMIVGMVAVPWLG
jgi:hypothetical protein